MTDESELDRVARELRQVSRIGELTSASKAMRDAFDTPAMKMIRDFHDSPSMRLVRQMQDSPSMRLMREMQNSPTMRLHREMALEQQRAIAAVHDNSLYKQISDFHKQQASLLPDIEHLRRTLLPASALQDSIRQITQSMAHTVFDVSIASRISSQLKTVLSSIERPWLSVDFPALSLQGVGALTALSHTVQIRDPFEESTRELVDHFLGGPIEVHEHDDEVEAEIAELDAGMDAGLVSLGAPETGEILELTGFKFVIPYAPTPQALNDDGASLHFHPSYFAFINQIEQRLRYYVEKEMCAAFGQDWVSARINQTVRNEWIERRETARSKGEVELSLIYYADLIQLKDIMIGKKTWPSLFSNTFGVKEHFMTTMDRIYAVRNPLAHSRPISNGQKLQLHMEGVAILRALGVRMLNS